MDYVAVVVSLYFNTQNVICHRITYLLFVIFPFVVDLSSMLSGECFNLKQW
jgi:hypothetical protein